MKSIISINKQLGSIINNEIHPPSIHLNSSPQVRTYKGENYLAISSRPQRFCRVSKPCQLQRYRSHHSAMGLHDYPQYVKYPMDLSTIHRKLREQRYRTVEEVLDDIQLIWDNCRCYNPTNSVLQIKLSGSTIFRKDQKRPSKRW